MEDLKSFIDDNQFKSIECFLEGLPTSIRTIRAYVKDSLSLQEASLKNPRAVLAASDGGIFATFNGDRKQKGYDEVEILALDKNESPTKWVTGIVKKQGNSLKLIQNPEKCIFRYRQSLL
ncbi:MAG: hypothetical protein KDD61_16390 [Bdellovibrionales bacterium]|nr:hypothetical protein [Bdellovibrionales bacterium]